MSKDLLHNWEKKTAERQKEYKQFLRKADKNKVLGQLPSLHDEAFSKINCLQCANCCKNYSPRFKTPDIKRISRHLKMKEGQFIETYLRADEEGDFVTKSSPCPFLGTNNSCSIYEVRPSDCHRFPYTNEDIILKRQELTIKNSTFCPIVYFVLEKLLETEKKKFPWWNWRTGLGCCLEFRSDLGGFWLSELFAGLAAAIMTPARGPK